MSRALYKYPGASPGERKLEDFARTSGCKVTAAVEATLDGPALAKKSSNFSRHCVYHGGRAPLEAMIKRAAASIS